MTFTSHQTVQSPETGRSFDLNAPGGAGKRQAGPDAGFSVIELSPRDQFAKYVDALYGHAADSGQLVESRAVVTWTEANKKKSRVVEHRWRTPGEFMDSYDELAVLNKIANIFAGVNLRFRQQGTKESVLEANCLSADIDNRSPSDAVMACQKIGLPMPSMVVNSGHGTHLYYLLEAPFRFKGLSDRERFEAATRGCQRAMGADCTHDTSRHMRVVGFNNVKNLRNGAPSAPCTLVHCDSTARFSAALFLDRWPLIEPERHVPNVAEMRLPAAPLARRVQGLVRYLDKEVSDRSKRDYGVIAGLLRLGLSTAAIWDLVEGKSKFSGPYAERYFQTTVANARKSIFE